MRWQSRRDEGNTVAPGGKARLIPRAYAAAACGIKCRISCRSGLRGVASRHVSPITEANAPMNRLDDYFPDHAKRVQEGKAVLLPKLLRREREHLLRRLRGAGFPSAEEELLLARGFAREFGEASLVAPKEDASHPRSEFSVRVEGIEIEIEARGLGDSQRAIGLGGSYSAGPVDWPKRLQKAIVKKLLASKPGSAYILVFTQYAKWLMPNVTLPLVRGLALYPQEFRIPSDKQPLAVAYVLQRWVVAIFFNRAVAGRYFVEDRLRERLRHAIRQSFYERADGEFIDESANEREQNDIICRIMGYGSS